MKTVTCLDSAGNQVTVSTKVSEDGKSVQVSIDVLQLNIDGTIVRMYDVGDLNVEIGK